MLFFPGYLLTAAILRRKADLGRSIWGKTFSVILVITILGALGALGYILASPKVGERFTEFYILALDGKATDYPEELKVGEEGKVTLGIVNHEYRQMSYRVIVSINGEKNNEIGAVVLEHDEKWESEISFVPKVAGENQKLEFLLYKNGEVVHDLKPLHLWIDTIK